MKKYTEKEIQEWNEGIYNHLMKEHNCTREEAIKMADKQFDYFIKSIGPDGCDMSEECTT